MNIIILLLAVWSTSCIAKNNHKGKKKGRISEQLAINTIATQNVATPIATISNDITPLNTLFNSLSQQINQIVQLAATDVVGAKAQLKLFGDNLKNAQKQLSFTVKTMHTIAKSIPAIDATGQLDFLQKQLNVLNTQSLTAGNAAQISILQNEIAALAPIAAQEKLAGEAAAKNYIMISNAVHDRIHIYQARKSDPNNFSAHPVASIPPNLNAAKIMCYPDYVYKIEVRKANGKLHNGKMKYGYASTTRTDKTQGQTDTFSDADKGHQLIVWRKKFSIHTLGYNGKGSLKATKAGFIAGMVILSVIGGVVAIPTGGLSLGLVGAAAPLGVQGTAKTQAFNSNSTSLTPTSLTTISTVLPSNTGATPSTTSANGNTGSSTAIPAPTGQTTIATGPTGNAGDTGSTTGATTSTGQTAPITTPAPTGLVAIAIGSTGNVSNTGSTTGVAASTGQTASITTPAPTGQIAIATGPIGNTSNIGAAIGQSGQTASTGNTGSTPPPPPPTTNTRD